MMPDMFDDITHTLAVPFFGRMLRVARRHRVLRAANRARGSCRCSRPQRASSACTSRSGGPSTRTASRTLEESQAIFMLNRALFASFEREIRRAAAALAQLGNVSAHLHGVDPPGRLEEDAPLRLLRGPVRRLASSAAGRAGARAAREMNEPSRASKPGYVHDAASARHRPVRHSHRGAAARARRCGMPASIRSRPLTSFRDRGPLRHRDRSRRPRQRALTARSRGGGGSAHHSQDP